jgi:hypothetical protein
MGACRLLYHCRVVCVAFEIRMLKCLLGSEPFQRVESEHAKH